MKKILLVCLVFTLLAAVSAVSDDGFGEIFGEGPAADEGFSGRVALSGEAGFELKTYIDDEWESELQALPRFMLEIAPSAGDLEALIRLNAEAGFTAVPGAGTAESAVFEPQSPSEVIDELRLRWFFNIGYLEAGLMKVEWGKGDGYHVLDPLNPLNQSAGIVPDLNDMKEPVSMVKLNFYLGTIGLAELVYVPFFSGHVLADSGRWALIDSDSLPNLSTDLPGGLSGFSAACRLTASLGPVDLGLQYYYGFKPEPGYLFETEFIGTSPMQMADPAFWQTDTTMLYTRAHLVGLEAGGAAGPFTFRLEAGGWITEDLEGDQPEYWNPSLVGLAGIDLLIPGTSILISIQATESWVLKYEDRGATDINTASAYDGKASNTNIIPAVEIPFAREKFRLRLAGIYLIEARGWTAFPSLSWQPVDDFEIAVNGQLFGGEEDSYYKSWEDNNNISLGFKYMF